MAILKKHDKVGFIAPSCGQQDKDLTLSINYLKSLGLDVVLSPNLNDEYRYMGGTDENIFNCFIDNFSCCCWYIYCIVYYW